MGKYYGKKPEKLEVGDIVLTLSGPMVFIKSEECGDYTLRLEGQAPGTGKHMVQIVLPDELVLVEK